MANGYGSSPLVRTRTTTNGIQAPPGFHYMPDGTLMSDAEHERLYNEDFKEERPKVIKSFVIDLKNISSNGEKRPFVINADNGAIFSLIVLNNHNNYYNFETQTFTTTPYELKDIVENNSYTGTISFPRLPDTNTDHYTFYLISSLEHNTVHTKYKEVRYPDNTIDFNSSTGSDSAVLLKKIYQHADKTITLSAISPNALTGFTSTVVTTDAITIEGSKTKQKISFTIIATAAATRNFVVKRQPIENDFMAYVERTIGSAGLAIPGEDVSSSTYYRWPINNIVGLQEGMFVLGNDVTAGSSLANYEETVTKTSTTLKKGLISSSYTEEAIIKFVKAVESTAPPTVTNGVITSQAGNIVFNKKQADALKDNAVKIYGYGPSSIKSISGYNIKLNNLKVELTPVTTTTTSAVSNSTSVPVAERDGILDDVSTVTGIGIDTSSAVPFVDSGAGTVNGAGTLVLSAAQTLEDGITLTFSGASRIATITGDIEILESGASDVTLRLDLEKILTAT
tara:strand:+ start:984 stop:2513 length:1530 start_codon:yes stop_codon:yes gene_type:complete